jgi:hypothetical protein
VVYSSMVYCPNVAIGWRSGVRRRELRAPCVGCCSSNVAACSASETMPLSTPSTSTNCAGNLHSEEEENAAVRRKTCAVAAVNRALQAHIFRNTDLLLAEEYRAENFRATFWGFHVFTISFVNGR